MLFTSRTHIRSFISLSAISLTLACQRDLPIPQVSTSESSSEAWQTLLEQSMGKDGIDWNNIEAHRDILETYIAWVGTVGPQSNRRNGDRFPKRGRTNYKLVHWVNSYNAWMMYSYLHHNKPSDLAAVDVTKDYFWGQRVYIDGEYTSFSHVKHERILADFQEPKLHFMLYELTEQSPLPHFWTPNTWKAKSDLAARTFMSSGMGARKTDGVWTFHPMFELYHDDFIDWSTAETLCEYLQEFTQGELKLWLRENNQTGCHLTFFSNSTTIPKGTERNSPEQ